MHLCNKIPFEIDGKNETSSVDSFTKLLEYFISMPDYENQIIQSKVYRIIVISTKTWYLRLFRFYYEIIQSNWGFQLQFAIAWDGFFLLTYIL